MTADAWPPPLPEATLKWMVAEANTYALTHGLCYLPSGSGDVPVGSLHAPFTLFPTPIPKHLFDRAMRLQRFYNALYSQIACEVDILDHVLGDEVGIGRVDNFTGRLWRGWKNLRDQGLVRQTLQLGMYRSDYLLHQSPNNSELCLKQVEFNTIAVSFGSLSGIVSDMHRHLYANCLSFTPSPVDVAQIPKNSALHDLAEGLARAQKAYGLPSGRVLFVVPPQERNVFDQRHLEYQLMKSFGINSVRLTLQQLQSASRIDPPSGSLHVTIPGSVDAWEISVIYFRAGYTPVDFQSASDYDVRFRLEASLAIKCPSIPLQLAGSKKIQEFMTHGDLLEQLLKKAAANGGEAFSEDDVASIRKTWMPMWSLDKDRGFGAQLARKHFKSLVLKPQREGGGNNIYHDHIPGFLDALPAAEYEAWIAMELINPPSVENVLIKTGDSKGTSSSTVSELGIYGWSLFDSTSHRESNVGGWLLRTKGKEHNEGGVAVGISVLDSPLLL